MVIFYLVGLLFFPFFIIAFCALFRRIIPRATMIKQTRKRLAPAETRIQVTGNPIAIVPSLVVFCD